MNTLLKISRYTLYIIIGFVLFIATYFLFTFILSSITIDKEFDSNTDVTIYIKTNGMHTDIVLPIKNELVDWSREIKYSNTHITDTSNFHYIGMGWGDKGFYLETPNWSDLKFSVPFKAAFGLSSTAIHATFYDKMNESESCKRYI